MVRPLLVCVVFLGAGVGLANGGGVPASVRHDPVVAAGVDVVLALTPGDPIAVWVFLTDKGIATPEALERALSDLAQHANPRCVQRRRLRRTLPGLFDRRDLPLAKGYVRDVLATGVRLRTQSRWLNAVSVDATRGQIDALAALEFVRHIKPIARAVRIEPPAPRPVTGGGRDFYGYASDQLYQINIPAAHAAGYTGDGVIIGILDTGFVRTHEAFNEPGHVVDVLGEWDVINDDGDTGIEDGDPGSQHWHGTLILGTIGAYNPNTLVGGAYDASFYLAKTEDMADEYPEEEDFYVAGLEWIEANGGDVATSSLSYIDWYTQEDLDGVTAVTTIGVNVATANGVVCCTAASNSGHDSDPNTSHLGAPADAFNVLTCGAVNSENEIAGFSSDGPTADGRLKPEVLARGVSTSSVDPNDDTDYYAASGTSLSTPLVASAAALILQAHPNWSVAQLRSAMLQTSDDYLANGTTDPLFIRGYGLIDVMAAIEMTFLGDVDRDGDTDLTDYALLADCLGGPGVALLPGCENTDLDGDGDADMDDFLLLDSGFTGPWSDWHD